MAAVMPATSPTTALVPYDHTFPDPDANYAYRLAWFRRLQREHVVEAFTEVATAVRGAFEDFTAIIRDATSFLSRLGRDLQDIGMLPPDPTNMLCGQRWVSPIDGAKWRVAGQRGNRHWIEAGPRGWRRP